jgi:uncharacterized protein YjbI with pentapeptide repeats
MLDNDFINPYPGTAPFQDCKEDRLIFFGREQEISRLNALVLSEQHVVLFARSGLGKTSLINAGELEELREAGFFPVVVRVSHSQEEGPIVSILASVKEEAQKQGVRIDEISDPSTLWEYFDKQKFFSASGELLKPILILDQFEELFTRLDRSMRERFVEQLADLASGRAPREMRNAALRELDESPGEANLGQPDAHRQRLLDIAYGNMMVDVKILISIREDFLGELEALKSRIPNLFRHMLRLEPLSRAQAEEAIVKPSQQKEILGANTIAIEPEAVREMLDFLSGQQVGGRVLQTDDIEPVYLQILCRSLFDHTHKKQRNEILVADLGGHKGMARILRRNYYEVVRQFPILRLGWSARKYRPALSNVWLFNLPRYAIRQLCESGLILTTGYRNILEGGYIASTYGVPQRDLEDLVHQRLLRSESRLRGRFYELAHDSLIDVLIETRKRRRIAQALGVAGIVAAVFLAGPAAMLFVQDVQAIHLQQIVASQEDEQTRRDAIIKLARPVPGLSHLATLLSPLSPLTDLSRVKTPVIDLSHRKLDKLNLDTKVYEQTFRSQWDFSSSSLSNSSLRNIPQAKEEALMAWPDPPARGEGRRFLLARQFVFDRSDIRRTSFDDSDLSLSSFDGANIKGATFRDAKLLDASFSGATLNEVDFSGASLSGVAWLFTDFMRAKLTSVDFSNADLKNVQFASAEIKEMNFTDTAWWLARGWNKQQIDQLKIEFPHTKYANSERYRTSLNEHNKRVENARKRKDADAFAIAINGRAWYRAIHGLELAQAKQDVSLALQEKPKESAFLDTKAYILMQNKDFKDFQEAKRLLASALDLLDRPTPSFAELRRKHPETLYKYALTLEYLGETAEAETYYQVVRLVSYDPTHENLLVPRPNR